MKIKSSVAVVSISLKDHIIRMIVEEDHHSLELNAMLNNVS